MKKSREVKEVKEIPPLFKSPKDVVNFFKWNFPVVLLIMILSLVAYANVLNGRFLSADDTTAIMRNEELKDLGKMVASGNIITIFSSVLVNVFGVVPAPFRVTSLFFHIINSCLVLLLVYMLLGKRYALYSGLLFSVLPTGSEAVFWISGKGYIAQAFFTLLSLNTYYLAKILRDKRFLFLSAFIYLVALISLQTAWMLTVPFIIVAVDIFKNGIPKKLGSYFHPASLKQGIKDYGPYVLITAIYWLVWMSGQVAIRVTSLNTDFYQLSYEKTPLLMRLPYTVYKALELYVFPIRLSFFHEEALTKDIYALMIGVTVLFFLFLGYLIFKKSRYTGLILAIMASFLPVFSPVQVAWFIAERYLYLGGAFFVMMLSVIIFKAEDKYKLNNFAAITLGIILTLYVVRDITRSNDFKTSRALWLATQKTAPYSYRVYNNLGDVYSSEQNWPAAISSFEYAIKIAPNYTDAIHNLGYTYLLMGDYENAKTYLTEAYRLSPELYQALEKLGRIEQAQGNIEKAKEYYDKAREINPGLPVPTL